MMATGAEFSVVEVGTMGATTLNPCGELKAGQVGYLTASIKNVRDTTCRRHRHLTRPPLPRTVARLPQGQCPWYSAASTRPTAPAIPTCGTRLEKLQLNDASLSFEPETSIALGFGFRCGFLGLLHMEIIQERLEREFNLDLVTTAPSVIYKVHLTDGDDRYHRQPYQLPGSVLDRFGGRTAS